MILCSHVLEQIDHRSEYDGGGTFFADAGAAECTGQGGVVSFDGRLLHGGHPISRGVRYIVVAFLYADT